MSALRDDPNTAEPVDTYSKDLPLTGNTAKTDAVSRAGSADQPSSESHSTRTNRASLSAVEHCELTGNERTYITRDVIGECTIDTAKQIIQAKNKEDLFNDIEAASVQDKETDLEPAQSPVDTKAADAAARTDITEKADAEGVNIYTAPVSSKSGQATDGVPYLDNIIHTDNNRKKKVWLYMPFVMVIMIILAIALPKMIEKLNHDTSDITPVETESTDTESVEKKGDVLPYDNMPTNNAGLKAPTDIQPAKPETTKDNISVKKDKAVDLHQTLPRKETPVINPPGPIDTAEVKSQKTESPSAKTENPKYNASQINNDIIVKNKSSVAVQPPSEHLEKPKKIDLIAKIDSTFKDLQALQNEKDVGIASSIDSEKTSNVKQQITAEKQPSASRSAKPEETNLAATGSRLEKTPEIKPVVKVPETARPLEVKQATKAPELQNVLEAKTAVKSIEPVKAPEVKPVVDVPAPMPVLEVKHTAKATEADKGSIAKDDKPKTTTSLPNVMLLVKRDKAGSGANNTQVSPSVTAGNLIKKWKPIGNTKSGVPIFIAPDNISHPHENVVNLFVKTSVDKKEFVDLLAINCSQAKLRILEERNGMNPAFSSYSREWKDISPDSMILYNSACPEKR
ncbi:MAG: hypothetical protein AB1499_06550 [Nitrospirota bacterium]